MPSHVSLTLNGSFVAVADGRAVSFAHRRAERLLAYLALHGPSDRNRVAHALWPAVDRERALASLRQALRAVSLEASEGWIVADRSSLRLDERVTVRVGEGKLLEAWDEPWIDDRPRTESDEDPPIDALFGLVAWYRDRAPETAFGMVAEAQSLLDAAPATRVAREIGPLLARLPQLPPNSFAVCNSTARAFYLIGEMEKAFALYGRIVRDLAASHPHHAAGARLSQVVILRESGAATTAARLAEEVVAGQTESSPLDWTARYHVGLAQHLSGQAGGLRTARAAVESVHPDTPNITRLFPMLNVAEALHDAGDPAAHDFLREAGRLAALSGDALGLLTVEMIENLLASRESPEVALEGLRALERRAWQSRFAPFAASLADRAAALAHLMGRRDEARRLLVRGDRVRKRLNLRRAPLENARIEAVRAAF